MAGGEEAIKKLADIDAGRGFRDPEKGQGRELGESYRSAPPPVDTSTSVLSDADLADMNLTQAKQMEAQAKSLLAEAKRLQSEAKSMTPKKVKNVRTTKKTTA